MWINPDVNKNDFLHFYKNFFFFFSLWSCQLCCGPSVQVMKVSSDKDSSSPLCMKTLASRGRLDTVSQQMASHPQYLESFLRTQHYILYMDGPLPHHYRHYIAIMVRVLVDDCIRSYLREERCHCVAL